MNLTDEYEQVRQHVRRLDFSQSPYVFASFFEDTIRYTGGLLSAYHLTKDQIFLSRADDLAKILLPAFNSSSGLPSPSVNVENIKSKMLLSCQKLFTLSFDKMGGNAATLKIEWENTMASVDVKEGS